MLHALPDAMCAALAQNGDSRALDELMRRHERIATGEASQWFLPGADEDDLRQEARVGLLKAIRAFRIDRGVPFDRYARFSIRRQLITAVKTARRMKHDSLTYAQRTTQNIDGDLDQIVDLIPDAALDPALIFERRQELRRVARDLRVVLSPNETAVVILWANGYGYDEIAARLRITTKQVDVRLTRARRKLTGEGPPSARERGATQLRERRVYRCPGCGLETVRVGPAGHERRGAGRPPLCNVCKAAKTA